MTEIIYIHNYIWRQKKEDEFKKTESIRVEKTRQARLSGMSPTELNAYKTAATARKRKSRLLQKQRLSESASGTSEATTDEMPSKPPQPYKRPQTLGKAVNNTILSLPASPRKRKAIVYGLAERFGVPLEDKMETALSEKVGNSGISEDVKKAVCDFYFCSDISYTMPGLKDVMTTWRDGKKEKLRKHHLTLFLREAFALFKELYPGISLGCSTFSRLRPCNVLLYPKRSVQVQDTRKFLYAI